MISKQKSNLAKLMANENIYVEQRKVETAYFDLESRTLVIPTFKDNLSENLMDLFIGHEISHALHTPPEGWHTAIVDLKLPRSTVNVVEDARIEKKAKRKYPGLKSSFLKGYREILELDFFEIANSNLNNLNLIDRINLETKCGVLLNINFNDEEKVLLNLVQNVETFDEVIEISKKIQEHMIKSRKERESNPRKSIYNGNNDSYDEDFDDLNEDIPFDDDLDFDIKFGQQEEEQGADDVKGFLDSFDDSEPEEREEEPELELDENGSTIAGGGDSFDMEESITDKAFRRNEHTLQGKTVYEYVNIPEFKGKDVTVDYKQIIIDVDESKTFKLSETGQKEYLAFKKSSSKTVSYLVKEFELRKNASGLAKAKTAKTGDLNMSKIFSHQFNDDIFKKITIVPNGKSHGLILFIDWSGSMNQNIHNTIKQLLTLVDFCKKVSIPYEVYAFSSGYRKTGDYLIKNIPIPKKPGDIKVGGFHLLNLLSSRMKTLEFKFMSEWLFAFERASFVGEYTRPACMHLNGTPLNQTIIAAMKIIPEFQKNYKLDVVNTVFLTDGDSENLNEHYDSTGNVIGCSYYYQRETRPVVVLRDVKTKEEIRYVKGQTLQQTKALLGLLRTVTRSNVVGFYIMASRNVKEVYSNWHSDLNLTTMENDVRVFRKDGSLTLNEVGYSELYLIKNESLVMDNDEGFMEDDEREDDEKIPTKTLVKQFTNYVSGKLTNKVVLTNFITMIA